MLRGSGCCFGVWFHSPLHFLSCFCSVSKLIRFFPKILNASYISGKKKKRQITSDSRFPPFPLQQYSSPLKSVVVLQPACRPLSAGFHGEQHRGSVVPVRNYAPWTVWLSSAGRTDGGMSMKVGQQSAFGSNLFQDLCCAPLPPLCQITLGSHSTLSVGPWGLFSATWWPQRKLQTRPLLLIPSFHLNVTMWNIICGNGLRTVLKARLSAYLWSVA